MTLLCFITEVVFFQRDFHEDANVPSQDSSQDSSKDFSIFSVSKKRITKNNK